MPATPVDTILQYIYEGIDRNLSFTSHTLISRQITIILRRLYSAPQNTVDWQPHKRQQLNDIVRYQDPDIRHSNV